MMFPIMLYFCNEFIDNTTIEAVSIAKLHYMISRIVSDVINLSILTIPSNGRMTETKTLLFSYKLDFRDIFTPHAFHANISL